MKKLIRHARTAAMTVVSVALLAGLVSCPSENPQSLFILDMMAMTVQQQCVVRPGQATQIVRMNGTLDLAITNRYFLFARFRNLLPELQAITGEGTNSLLGEETNIVTVTGASVQVDLTQFGGEAVKVKTIAQNYLDIPFHTLVFATAEPETDGVAMIEAIPSDLGNFLAEQMRGYAQLYENPGVWTSVTLQLEAVTQDDWLIHSNTVTFPLQLCWGCLIRPITNDPGAPPESSALPCLPGQDDAVDNTFCPLVAIYKDVCTQSFQ